jgi:hypothetical protein
MKTSNAPKSTLLLDDKGNSHSAFEIECGPLGVARMRKWTEKGFTEDQAAKWYEAGYITPKAAQRATERRKKVLNEYAIAQEIYKN